MILIVLIHVQLFVTLWIVAHQAPLSTELSRQEYWSGLPCPPAGDLPNPRKEPVSRMSPELGGKFFTTSATWEAHIHLWAIDVLFFSFFQFFLIEIQLIYNNTYVPLYNIVFHNC